MIGVSFTYSVTLNLSLFHFLLISSLTLIMRLNVMKFTKSTSLLYLTPWSKNYYCRVAEIINPLCSHQYSSIIWLPRFPWLSLSRYLFLSAIAFSKSSRQYSVSTLLMNVNFCLLTTVVCLWENITYEFVLTFPAMLIMSYWDCLWDGR